MKHMFLSSIILVSPLWFSSCDSAKNHQHSSPALLSEFSAILPTDVVIEPGPPILEDFPLDAPLGFDETLGDGLGEELPPGTPGDPAFPTNACGNGVRNFNEQCDDGNDSNLDDCNNVCGRPSCGNAVLEIREECDDGGNADGDGCSARCLYERCGNFRLDDINNNTEECDDGNFRAGDGCSRACTIERCGNNILDPDEQCDNGTANNDSGPCTTCCLFEPACPVTPTTPTRKGRKD